MDHVMDLDEVVAEVAARRSAWQTAGIVVDSVTWRDSATPWPQRLETDRATVSDPDSVGFHLHSSHKHGAELRLVVFRGGWVDADFIADIDDAGVISTPAISSAEAFGTLIDTCVARVFSLQDPT
ncbi:hypothetical protein [Streptomyces tauricus]|uniref:hypothetical protein n=1 Tax=Streptomyces tauricus TaxID=68274 RepID=UPI002242D7D9|nr:hypothetical protein [Streptomyces tauricus]MCW8102914.1 hypothetical protein [Streptomyces tauricus]